MQEHNKLWILGIIGLPISVLTGMLLIFFLSMSTFLLKTNPNLEVNAVFFHGSLNEMFPFVLVGLPIMFFPFGVFLYCMSKQPNRSHKTPNKNEVKQQ